MEHAYSDFDVTADYHHNPPPPPPPSAPTHTRPANTADRSPLTPGHDPGFLDGFLPSLSSYSGLADLDDFDPNSHYFADAYRPSSPSPPRRSFFENILNPAGYDHNRYSPFAYRNSPPTLHQTRSIYEDMPPTTRARLDRLDGAPRPARLPNGYVDLTATPDSPPQQRKRHAPTPGPASKRQRRGDGTAAERASSESVKVEEVDLTDDKITVQEVLQKQREDAVQSQTRPEEKPTTFNTFSCVICMDNPTDLTATACGMMGLNFLLEAC